MFRNNLASQFSFAIVVLATAAVLAQQDSMKTMVDRFAQPYIDGELVAGMTVGIVKDGKPHAFGYGLVSDKGKTIPDGQTIYEIGSVSKTFTGLLLADAVQHQSIRLDQPVQELLPDGVAMPQKGEKPITLQDLSTHVSGLPRLPGNLEAAAEDPYANYTTKDLYEFLDGCTLTRAPGEASEYSNLAVGLLGTVLAARAESTYEEILRHSISEPLGMNDTVTKLSADQQARLAAPYVAVHTPAVNWGFDALVGAGGIYSTVDDMMKFASAFLDPPQSDLGAAIELTWKIHQKPLKEGDFAMGLGWHVAHDGQTRWHNGQTAGYHSMVLINRSLNLAVVVLSNTATGEIDQLGQTLVQSLAGMNVQPREVVKPKTKVAVETMRRYEGKFELAPSAIFAVSVQEDRLMVGLTGQPTFQVFPQSDTEWKYKVVDATLTFKVGDDGKCNELDLFQNGIHQKAKRIN